MDDFYTSMFAEGLAPFNQPSFTSGSAVATDIPDLSGKLGTPFTNLQVAQEYLATAQSLITTNDVVDLN